MLARWGDLIFFLFIFFCIIMTKFYHIYFILYILKYLKYDFYMTNFVKIELHDFLFHYL